MAKTALILYWHGLGDIIILTPIMRYLYQQGYLVDLMCHELVAESHLLDCCLYIGKLIPIPNPWWSKWGFEKQKQINIVLFTKMAKQYDWSAKCPHNPIVRGCKIQTNWHECNLQPADNQLEVFISSSIEKRAMEYIAANYPNGYIFQHTKTPLHKYHHWNAHDWIQSNLPNLPIVNTGQDKTYSSCRPGPLVGVNPDINFSFVLAREATHRVLSSSVFVHACEAMGVKMDVINYGKPDRKVWPKDQSLVMRIREEGKWIK